MSMFYVGQKVVCTTDKWGPFPLGATKLPKGEVYTIRDKIIIGGELGLRFEEVVNPVSFYGELAYAARFFRPVVTTNIDIFTAMLKTTREGVSA